ncbi:hypothetical protein OROMI_022747 [Orobanche minor]
MSSGRYMAYSPSPSAPHSPHIGPAAAAAAGGGIRPVSVFVEQEKYLAELLAERNKLNPFMAVLPNCYRLLNQVTLPLNMKLFTFLFGFILDILLREELKSIQGGREGHFLVHREAFFGSYILMLLCHVIIFTHAIVDSQFLTPSLVHAGPLANLLATLVDCSVILNSANWYILFLEIDLFETEILHVTTLLGNASVLEQSGFEHASPLASGGIYSNGGANMNIWASPFQSEKSGLRQPSSAPSWLASQVDHYPNFNFVGRLLGPRGNSLKRVEATTDCRVLIRGRGSIKDPAREEMMRGKPGYEHLNEPLHILVEAELPVEIIDARLMQAREILEDLLKPVDEFQDFYKQQQLRELAILNGTLREESSQMSGGSVSPFHNSLGMKRAKTRG